MPLRLPRVRVPERMDSPSLPPEAHREALRGLARLNRLSASHAPFLREVRRFARSWAGKGPIRVLDVAAGGGDLLAALARRAVGCGQAFEWHALDRSEVALEEAALRARRLGMPLTTHRGDATVGPLPAPIDIVTCALFLHHLDPPGATRALRLMRDSGAALALVCDLRRTRVGLALAAIASRLMSRSPVVHFDAVASVRAAYTPGELRALAEAAGLRGARVRRAWPQRMLLTWRRDA